MSLKQRTTELSNFQFSLLLALPVLVFLVLVVAYPLGYALWMSVHEISFFGGYKATFVGAENYADVIGDRKFKKSLWITVRFTLESVALAMVIGLLIALVLNRPMRFAGLVRTIVILPWCISLYGTGIIFSLSGQGANRHRHRHRLRAGDRRGGERRQPPVGDRGTGGRQRLEHGAAGRVLPARQPQDDSKPALRPRRHRSHVPAGDVSERHPAAASLHALRLHLHHDRALDEALRLHLRPLGGGPGTASSTLTYRIYKESFKDLDLGYGAAMSFMLLALILGTTLLLYAFWGGGRRGRYEDSPLHGLVMAGTGGRRDLDPAADLLVPEELPADARRDRTLSAAPLSPGADARRFLQHLRLRVRNGRWPGSPRLRPGQSDHPGSRQQPHRLGGGHGRDAVRGAAAGIRLCAPRLSTQEQAPVRDPAGGRAAAGLDPHPVSTPCTCGSGSRAR